MSYKSESVSWTAFKINELRTILEEETNEDCAQLKSKKDYVNACRKLDRHISQKWFRKLRKLTNDDTPEKSMSSQSSTVTTRTHSDSQVLTAAKTSALPSSSSLHKSLSNQLASSKLATRASSVTRSGVNAAMRVNVTAPKAPPSRTSIDASRLARQQLTRVPSKGIPASLFSSSSSAQSPLDSEEDTKGTRTAMWQSSRRPSSPQTRSKDFDRVEQQLQRSLRLLSSSETPKSESAEVDSEIENVKPLPSSLDHYKTPSMSHNKAAMSRPPTCRRQDSSRLHRPGTYSSTKNHTPISKPVLTPLKEAFTREEEETTSDPTPLLRPVPVANASQPSPPSFTENATPEDIVPPTSVRHAPLFSNAESRVVSSNLPPSRKVWLYNSSPWISAIIAALVASWVFLAVPPKEPLYRSIRLCIPNMSSHSSECISVCPEQATCDDENGAITCDQLRKLVAIAPGEWQCLVDDTALDKLLKPIIVRLNEDYVSQGCELSRGIDIYDLLADLDPEIEPRFFSSALNDRYDEVTERYNIEGKGFYLRLANPSPKACTGNFHGLSPGRLSLFSVFAIAGFLLYRQVSLFRALQNQVANYIESKTQIVTPDLYILGPSVEEVSSHLLNTGFLPPSYCSKQSVMFIAKHNRNLVMCGLRHVKNDFLFSRSKANSLLKDMDQLRLCHAAIATPKLKGTHGGSRAP